jgi:hypothetical protein
MMFWFSFTWLLTWLVVKISTWKWLIKSNHVVLLSELFHLWRRRKNIEFLTVCLCYDFSFNFRLLACVPLSANGTRDLLSWNVRTFGKREFRSPIPTTTSYTHRKIGNELLASFTYRLQILQYLAKTTLNSGTDVKSWAVFWSHFVICFSCTGYINSKWEDGYEWWVVRD